MDESILGKVSDYVELCRERRPRISYKFFFEVFLFILVMKHGDDAEKVVIRVQVQTFKLSSVYMHIDVCSFVIIPSIRVEFKFVRDPFDYDRLRVELFLVICKIVKSEEVV